MSLFKKKALHEIQIKRTRNVLNNVKRIGKMKKDEQLVEYINIMLEEIKINEKEKTSKATPKYEETSKLMNEHLKANYSYLYAIYGNRVVDQVTKSVTKVMKRGLNGSKKEK